VNLSKKEAEEVSEILSRRANEIAIYKTDMMKEKHYLGSVELALTREMERLRSLAEKVNPMILED
jgi:hypothetical protein